MRILIVERVRNISSKCFQSGFRMMSEYIYFSLFPIVVLYILRNCYLYLCICRGGENAQVNLDFQKPQALLGGGLTRGGKLKGIKVHLTPSCKICKPGLLYLHVLTLLKNRPAAVAQRFSFYHCRTKENTLNVAHTATRKVRYLPCTVPYHLAQLNCPECHFKTLKCWNLLSCIFCFSAWGRPWKMCVSYDTWKHPLSISSDSDLLYVITTTADTNTVTAPLTSTWQ